MKQQRAVPEDELKTAAHRLAKAFLVMQSEEECLALLDDLCTPAELEAIVDRFRAAELLAAGMPYRQIHELTGVSVTTIGRVARYLARGAGGYRLALRRLKRHAGSKP